MSKSLRSPYQSNLQIFARARYRTRFTQPVDATYNERLRRKMHVTRQERTPSLHLRPLSVARSKNWLLLVHSWSAKCLLKIPATVMRAWLSPVRTILPECEINSVSVLDMILEDRDTFATSSSATITPVSSAIEPPKPLISCRTMTWK